MIRALFETDESASARRLLYLFPEFGSSVDAGFAFGDDPLLGLGHLRRQNRQQHVAIVGLAERVLQEREKFRRFMKFGLEAFETFQRVAKPLARDAKIVQPLLIAPFEAAGEPAHFSEARLQYPRNERAGVRDAVEIDAVGLHARATVRIALAADTDAPVS